MVATALRLNSIVRPRPRWKRHVVTGLAGLLLTLWASLSQGAEKTSKDYDLDYLSLQIKTAEADRARATLEQIITDIQLDQGRYAYALVAPLTLLGDAHMALQNSNEAADHYAHALHLSRSNQGLFAPSQVDVVYRQAALYTAAGNLLAARQREEYAFEVLQRHHGQASLDLLPAIERLGEFYQRSFNFLGARVLFKRALATLAAHDRQTSEAAIPYLQGVAKSYLTERFPPFYSESQFDPRAQSGLREMDLTTEYISISNFPAGERALQSVVAIRQQSLDRGLLDPEISKSEVFRLTKSLHAAMLDLADWHQMFGHIREARALYNHLFNEIDDAKTLSIAFDEPKLLYFPKPKDPKRPSDSTRQAGTGEVGVRFDVLPTGRIRNLETVTSIPDGLMDFQVRRNLRDAIFRPAINAEGPITSKGYSYRYEFNHYSKLDAKDPEIATSSEPGPEQAEAP